MVVDDIFVVSMTFLSTQSDLIQNYARLHKPFILVTREKIIHINTSHNSFSSQQTNVISRVDSVLCHWLDRI